MSLFSTTTALAAASSNITSALGLDGWQLKDGKYNGCSFVTFVPIPFLQGNTLFQAGTDSVAMFNSATGGVGNDPNSATQLYQTKLGILQFTDNMMQGKVVKKTPYTNQVNIEDTGFQGYEFSMSLIFLGDDYVKAVANFENVILNPPENPENYMVLHHPIRGRIGGFTFVTDFKVVTSLAYYNGCIANVTFRAVNTNGAVTKVPILSTAQQIARAVNTALALVNGIGSTVNQIQGTVKNINSGGLLEPRTWTGYLQKNIALSKNTNLNNSHTSFLTLTEYNQIAAAVSNVQNTLLNSVAYMCRYGNSPVKVAQLSALDIDYNYLPKSLNQFKKYVLVQADIICNYYAQQIAEVSHLIELYGVGADANDLLIQLTKSQALLLLVAQSIGNRVTTKTYVVPYDMSIIKVLANNNISLSKVNAVMQLNPEIVSSNYITSGTSVNLV